MRRKATILLLAAGALFAVGLAPASAQKQTLRMAYWAGPAHQMVQTQEAWIKTIEAASGGNLTVVVMAAPAKPEGQYDLIKNGVRDLVWAVPSYTQGRFDMSQVAELPFLCPNSTVCSPILWKWYAKFGLATKEFPDTTLLTTFTSGPFLVHTTKVARTLEAIRTLKLRVAGASVPMSVVAMPATDAYEMLQRGTVEGTLLPWEAVKSFRLTELLKFHLEVPGGVDVLLRDRRQHQSDRQPDSEQQGGATEGERRGWVGAIRQGVGRRRRTGPQRRQAAW
jgi:TRAP-type C4-dicarboxylate transport system substrate-binding protein